MRAIIIPILVVAVLKVFQETNILCVSFTANYTLLDPPGCTEYLTPNPYISLCNGLCNVYCSGSSIDYLETVFNILARMVLKADSRFYIVIEVKLRSIYLRDPFICIFCILICQQYNVILFLA